MPQAIAIEKPIAAAKKRMNIVGGGRVGKVFGRLFAQYDVFQIQDVLNQSLDSAQNSVQFIGAGKAVSHLQAMRSCDVLMLAVPDDRIAPCFAALLSAGCLAANPIVFHCSGAHASAVLAAPDADLLATASVHPVRSFADPSYVAQHFSGTFCSVEGNPEATAILHAALQAIGAQTFSIEAEHKPLYHAAAVFASNYLVSLMDIAQRTYIAAGIPQDIAVRLAEPLARETIDNVFRLGPESALSGPIARGDLATVARQQAAIDAWNTEAGMTYRALAASTLDLAKRKKRIL